MALNNTHYGAKAIEEMLCGAEKLFFAGIGGVSMCSLARMAKLRGYIAEGYDRAETDTTRSLEADGIRVYYTADESHIDNCDMLVYTVAMPADNPEYAGAMRRGIPCVSRADFLNYIMSGYRHRIGISGTHGKSTTTSLISKLFGDAGLDPAANCGAVMKDVGCEYRIGNGEFFIFEACEYMDSFLDFSPTLAIILNIEMDHVDYFHSMEQIRSSFASFISCADAALVNCGDDDVMCAAKDFPARLYTFGVDMPDADYCAANITFRHGCPSFDFIHAGEKLCRISLCIPGAHLVCDALAAAAAAHLSGISPAAAAASLAGFEGAGRRMDYMGRASCGADIYTDYAHHPTEIATTLAAATQTEHKRVFCVFQPHTYSRTKQLFDDFAASLSGGGAYEIILAPIYSAREADTLGVSSQLLADKICENGSSCRYVERFEDIARRLNEAAGDGDMLLVMGAGDITGVISHLKEEVK